MNSLLVNAVTPLCGLVAGALIGVSFGCLQSAAWKRHRKLDQTGELKSGWAVMPGSFRRVGYLLILLALIQVLCPLLFAGGGQWWVSGGVVAGYALMLGLQLRQRLSHTN